MAKKKAQSIPLDSIPERKKHWTQYTTKFKQAAVDRLKNGDEYSALALELGVTDTTLRTWQRELDPLAGLRAEINEANGLRKKRLEMAAAIVEAEGTYISVKLARSIRALGGMVTPPGKSFRVHDAKKK